MNTNGALKSAVWWQELANIFNQPQDYVVFSIDGLEDTNHIYRKNVVWSKLIENAQAFIKAGGSAHWDMLVYQHNQHQVDLCEQLARDMGFSWFRAKVSKRPYINGLEFPVGWKNPIRAEGTIHCQALKESSLYIDAQGREHPCCWLGSRLTDFVTMSQVQESWATTPHPTCQKTCSTANNSFTNQWQREVQL
jgi:sulfatase maturation enzyme AslB (radical SAM superfamily)